MLSCKNCQNYSPKKGMCRLSGGARNEEDEICKDFTVFPIEREIDGVWFRVKRNGKWGNVCFSDMTPEEREEVIVGKTAEWWKSLACIMGDTLRAVADKFDITAVKPENE